MSVENDIYANARRRAFAQGCVLSIPDSRVVVYIRLLDQEAVACMDATRVRVGPLALRNLAHCRRALVSPEQASNVVDLIPIFKITRQSREDTDIRPVNPRK